MVKQLDEFSSAVFNDVEEMMSATEAELVDGMLMNSYICCRLLYDEVQRNFICSGTSNCSWIQHDRWNCSYETRG